MDAPRRTCKLLQPLIQGGVEHQADDTVDLRPDQAARLAAQGVIEAPRKSARRKQED